MKNKLTSLTILSFLSLFINCSVAFTEQFNFNVSEIDILENGNRIVGSKRGEITTDDGVIISADNFVYNKIENTLAAKGNVVFVDKINNYIITSEIINYNKTEETINTTGDTQSEIYSRYSINSKDKSFLKNEKIKNSNYKTTIIDNEYQTLYKLKNLILSRRRVIKRS